MKKFLCITLAIFLSATALLAREQADRQADQATEKEQKETKPALQKKTQPPVRKGEPWPRTFVPSEKINADTVVSFPADI
jgi:hypothetical protein